MRPHGRLPGHYFSLLEHPHPCNKCNPGASWANYRKRGEGPLVKYWNIHICWSKSSYSGVRMLLWWTPPHTRINNTISHRWKYLAPLLFSTWTHLTPLVGCRWGHTPSPNRPLCQNMHVSSFSLHPSPVRSRWGNYEGDHVSKSSFFSFKLTN